MNKAFILIGFLITIVIMQIYLHKGYPLIADEKIIDIKVKEINEPLIDLKNQDIIAFGPPPEIPDNTDYTKMRKSVYEKLVEAQKLLPNGLKFCVYEAYRSFSLQEKLFNDCYNKIKAMHPRWSEEKIFVETTRLVSPVINLDGYYNILPHHTGAAIAVYLIDSHNEPVDMGYKVKDWIEDLECVFSSTNSQKISKQARKNRMIMGQALSSVGFVNYPTQYWHWSYGDKYWAYYKRKKYAIYGNIE